jgi:hypothetical protein
MRSHKPGCLELNEKLDGCLYEEVVCQEPPKKQKIQPLGVQSALKKSLVGGTGQNAEKKMARDEVSGELQIVRIGHCDDQDPEVKQSSQRKQELKPTLEPLPGEEVEAKENHRNQADPEYPQEGLRRERINGLERAHIGQRVSECPVIEQITPKERAETGVKGIAPKQPIAQEIGKDPSNGNKKEKTEIHKGNT